MKTLLNRVEKLERFGAYNSTAAESGEAPQREVEDAKTFSSRQQIISWVCCLIAAGIMIETLFYKFTGAAESKHIFHKMGTEPWISWVQGVWELLASICLLWPRRKMGGRDSHDRRDAYGDFESHNLAGLLDSGRSWAAP